MRHERAYAGIPVMIETITWRSDRIKRIAVSLINGRAFVSSSYHKKHIQLFETAGVVAFISIGKAVTISTEFFVPLEKSSQDHPVAACKMGSHEVDTALWHPVHF